MPIPTEKSSLPPAGEPALSLGGLFCTVCGGDGEGLPAFWQQGVIVKVASPMAVDLVVTKDLTKIRAMGEQQVTVEVTLLKGDETLHLTARARLAPKDC